MRKLLKLFLALSVCSAAFPQINDISRLSSQSLSQSFEDSAPVWLSENQLLIFYINESRDTIYSTRSDDAGLSWNASQAVHLIAFYESQESLYLTALRTNSGRIVLSWSIIGEGMSVIYSDDSGNSWSSPEILLGPVSPIPSHRTSCRYLHLSQLKDNTVLLSFTTPDQTKIHYRKSYDEATSWDGQNYIIVRQGSYFFNDHTIISIDDSTLLTVFKLKRPPVDASYDIYSRLSIDNGITWGDTIMITATEAYEHSPRLFKDESGNLWLAYLRADTIFYPTRSTYSSGRLIQNDIFYKQSTDNGVTWEDEERFTKYLGDDKNLNLTLFGQSPFVCFSSKRFNGRNQIFYGILDLSSDSFTPPLILSTVITPLDLTSHSVTLNSTVFDDKGVSGVYALTVDSTIVELFDDGIHDDVNAGDSIYGNSLPISFEQNSTTGLIEANKILLPNSNNGVLSDTRVNYYVTNHIYASDIENNTASISPILYNYLIQSKYGEASFLFSGGFFISGYSNNTLWACAQATASRINNFLPGKVGMDPEDPLNLVYNVFSTDPPFGTSWHQWKDAVLLGADFYDGDGDGVYNPVDKNWNGIWDPIEDMPDLLGDQTSWCVFNDGVPVELRERFAGVEPQGIELHQTLFASAKPGLDEIIFIRYKLFNRGTVADVMDSVYFTFWSDPDLGDHLDDLVASDTLLSSGFIYNKDEDAQYGNNPPAFYNTLLQGPSTVTNFSTDTAYNHRGTLMGIEEFSGQKNLDITSIRHYQSSDPILGDPSIVYGARNYMIGLNKVGNQFDPCTSPLGQVRGGVNCNLVNPLFVYSGDPVEDVGWINIVATDQRLMVNFGPFTLEKDKPVTIIGAYVLGRGTDHLNSITVARQNVQRAIEEYQSNFASMTYNPGEPVYPVDNYVLYQNYPNPFNPTTTIRYELPQDGVVTIELFDILGQKVKTILNQFRKADRYEVSFNAAGLASGVYIYRIKVNDFIQSKKMLLIH